MKLIPEEEQHGCLKKETISEYQNCVIDDGSFVHKDDVKIARKYADMDFIRNCVDNGKRVILCRLRRRVENTYCWIIFEINVPADYSKENPWVTYSWKVADSGMISMEDAMQAMAGIYYRVLHLNLTEDTYEKIDLYSADHIDASHLSGRISELTQQTIAQGYIYEEDIADYRALSDVEHLRKQFLGGVKNLNFTYRRRVGDTFRWVIVEIVPTMRYSNDKQSVVCYTRDIQEERSELLNNFKQLEAECYKDSLTGLYNRFYFKKISEEYQNRKEKNSVGIIFADLNGLKYVNDTFGHYEGDAYLKAFARVITDIFGEQNCFRISGDEYMIYFQGISKHLFLQKVQCLKEYLEHQIMPMASIGMDYQYAPNEICDVIKCAESNMYRMKRAYYKEYQNFSGEDSEKLIKKRDVLIEQIISKDSNREQESGNICNYRYGGNKSQHEKILDKTGLSSRMFDIFAATAKINVLFLCNLNTNVSRWSKEAVAYFGLPGEYMYDASAIWEKHIHPDDLKQYLEEYAQIANGDKLYAKFSYRARNKDGQYVKCTCQCTVVKGENGEPDFFSGIIVNHGIC